MDNYGIIEEELLELLKQNPEELKHAKDTLNWLIIINPNSDAIQRISALGHDIERAINPWKLNGHVDEKLNEKDFRMEHAKRSAEILKNILLKHKISEIEIQRMQNMVLNHEFGGNSEANLVRDADSLANFQWVDDMWGTIDRVSLEDVMRRMFNRMSEEKKKFAKQVEFKHAEVKKMFDSLF
ncbi:DUF4202 domain-containing protein [Candidatus Pacearchaeota archaeon]|nr:DUF4202 domain-containing protein [Candidatus Pacearchaeota archaeon]